MQTKNNNEQRDGQDSIFISYITDISNFITKEGNCHCSKSRVFSALKLKRSVFGNNEIFAKMPQSFTNSGDKNLI